MRHKLIGFILLISGLVNPDCWAQQTLGGSEKSTFLDMGYGVPYYHLRDKAASSLSHKGWGYGQIHLGIERLSTHTIIADKLMFGYGEIRPAIQPKADLLPVAIYRLQNEFLYLRRLKQLSESKLSLWIGGKIRSTAQYTIYPYRNGNNSDAYTIDWFSISPLLKMNYELDGENASKHQDISLLVGASILSLTERPQAFSGIPAESLFKEISWASLHNNQLFHLEFAYTLTNQKGNRIRMGYQWGFMHNTTAIHALKMVQSALSVSYVFHLRSK